MLLKLFLINTLLLVTRYISQVKPRHVKILIDMGKKRAALFQISVLDAKDSKEVYHTCNAYCLPFARHYSTIFSLDFFLNFVYLKANSSRQTCVLTRLGHKSSDIALLCELDRVITPRGFPKRYEIIVTKTVKMIVTSLIFLLRRSFPGWHSKFKTILLIDRQQSFTFHCWINLFLEVLFYYNTLARPVLL